MAGAASAISDNRCRLLHDRFPIGIGFLRDEHFTFLKFVERTSVSDHADRAACDLRTHTSTREQDLPAPL
jgi:hypothetical protein